MERFPALPGNLVSENGKNIPVHNAKVAFLFGYKGSAFMFFLRFSVGDLKIWYGGDFIEFFSTITRIRFFERDCSWFPFETDL